MLETIFFASWRVITNPINSSLLWLYSDFYSSLSHVKSANLSLFRYSSLSLSTDCYFLSNNSSFFNGTEFNDNILPLHSSSAFLAFALSIIY